MPKHWITKECAQPDDSLIKAAGSDIIAKLLMQRGIDTAKNAEKFLNPLEIEPVSPYAYTDMAKAISRISVAIENKEHILIYGDFDADGVTSTAVLHKAFEHLGAVFSHYIPDRQTESHGLSKSVLLKKISKEKVKLVITVDCGISDCDEIALVKTFGVDTIVTDHHEPQEKLPPAYAILDAKAEGSLSDDLCVEEISSLTSMAGVGAAFKLACALLESYDKINFAENLLPLVALGTVADIMPLLHENRLFVALGLKLIEDGKNSGITALLRSAGLNPQEKMTTEKIAFTIAPRINAAGRLDSADTAFKLLTSDNPAELVLYSQSLSNFNKMRQELSDEIYLSALEYIEKNNFENDPVLVTYNPHWHVGIIGIVASRLVEKFNKPVFMFTDAPDGETLRSSARSIEGVNIFNVLEVNSDIIKSYGGHSMAAGLALDKNQTSLERFREAVNSTVFEMTDGVIPQPVLNVDLEISLDEISLELLDSLNKMEPFGEGNSYPVFAIKDLILAGEKVLGQNKNHLKFTCEDSSANTVDCVLWKTSTLNIPLGKKLDIAFYPKINEFNGVKSLQLDIKDYNSEFITEASKASCKVIDHRKKTGILAQVADYIKTSQKKFKIFAEDKEIVKNLSEDETLSSSIVSRLSTEPADQLMFFDYPADKGLMEFILKSVNPEVVHFMNYRTPPADIDLYINKISGMLKFAYSKYDGKVYLPDISAALSIADELTTLIIKLLNRTNVIKVQDFENGKIHFEFLAAVPFSDIKAHEIYESCRMELFKSKKYRDELVSAQNLSECIRK